MAERELVTGGGNSILRETDVDFLPGRTTFIGCRSRIQTESLKHVKDRKLVPKPDLIVKFKKPTALFYTKRRRWICQIDQVSWFRDAKLFPVNCCAYILTIDRFWPWGRPCTLVDWGCLSYSSCAWELSNFLNYSSCLCVYRLRAIYPRFALLVVNDITF